eukprot:scaffold48243_cov73-Phaeocystis_antarctica.AAC.1
MCLQLSLAAGLGFPNAARATPPAAATQPQPFFINRSLRTARARDAQLTTLKNTTRRAHGQEAQRPLAPRPWPSYDHASCMETSRG